MRDWDRRRFLERTLQWIGLAACAPLLGVATAARAEDTKAARLAVAIREVYGARGEPRHSAAVALDVPVFAESGRSVPVGVSTELGGVKSIGLFVQESESPFAAMFEIDAGAKPAVATRLQVPSTSDIVAVVDTAEGLFMNRVDVIIQSADGCFGS